MRKGKEKIQENIVRKEVRQEEEEKLHRRDKEGLIRGQKVYVKLKKGKRI